jgi:hypothetical protein
MGEQSVTIRIELDYERAGKGATPVELAEHLMNYAHEANMPGWTAKDARFGVFPLKGGTFKQKTEMVE